MKVEDDVEMIRAYPCSRCGKSVSLDAHDATSVAITEYRAAGHAVDVIRKDYDPCGPCWRALQAFVRGEEPPAEPEKPERETFSVPYLRGKPVFGSTGS